MAEIIFFQMLLYVFVNVRHAVSLQSLLIYKKFFFSLDFIISFWKR